MLQASGIRVTLGGTQVLSDVSVAVGPSEVVAVLGPNGAGKSTLLAVLSGAQRAFSGRVDFAGRPLGDWPPHALARQRAVMAQHSQLGFPFRVLEVVLLGRCPHAGESSRAEDLTAAEAALAEAEADHLVDRVYTTLSGGEKQRVHLARVLAQIGYPPPVGTDCRSALLLDEPTSSLDPAHQHTTLATARRAAARGVGVVAVLHDLNLAAMYADRIVMLNDGHLAAEGPPSDVLTEDTVAAVFGLPVHVTRHPTRNCPHIVAL